MLSCRVLLLMFLYSTRADKQNPGNSSVGSGPVSLTLTLTLILTLTLTLTLRPGELTLSELRNTAPAQDVDELALVSSPLLLAGLVQSLGGGTTGGSDPFPSSGQVSLLLSHKFRVCTREG